MSTVTVQLFASYAEAFGEARIEVPIRKDCTVGDLVSAIRALPGGALVASGARVAVNRKFARPDDQITGSDELALIPPVAGG